MNKRPEPCEYASFYGGYVSSVEGTDIIAVIEAQIAEIEHLFSGVDDIAGRAAYAPGKWTLKEVISHLIDGERVFSYRLLRISRGDRTPIAGFDQDPYVAESGANDVSVADLVAELTLLRRANIHLLKNLKPEAWSRMGTASDAAISVRALAYILAGHIAHHLGIVRDRYLA